MFVYSNTRIYVLECFCFCLALWAGPFPALVDRDFPSEMDRPHLAVQAQTEVTVPPKQVPGEGGSPGPPHQRSGSLPGVTCPAAAKLASRRAVAPRPGARLPCKHTNPTEPHLRPRPVTALEGAGLLPTCCPRFQVGALPSKMKAGQLRTCDL